MTNDKQNSITHQKRINRLLKIEILRGHNAFKRVFTQGKTVDAPFIKAFVLCKKEDIPQLLVGFSVTRSIRKAVERNFLKRRMREAYRHNKMQLYQLIESAEISLTIVFFWKAYPNAPVKKISYSSIEQNIQHILQTIERMYENRHYNTH